jgi:hypothetical protein
MGVRGGLKLKIESDLDNEKSRFGFNFNEKNLKKLFFSNLKKLSNLT